MKQIIIFLVCLAYTLSGVAQKPYKAVPATISAVKMATQTSVKALNKFGKVGAIVYSAARALDTMASASALSSHAQILVPAAHDISIVSAIATHPATSAVSDFPASRTAIASFNQTVPAVDLYQTNIMPQVKTQSREIDSLELGRLLDIFN